MFDLRIVLSVIIVLFAIHEISCDESVTIPYKGKNYEFNVKALNRKIFYNVPIWTIESTESEDLMYTYEGVSKINGVLHEDETMKAILIEKNNCTSNCWEGVFGLGTLRNVISDKPEAELLSKNPEFDISGVYKMHALKNSVSRNVKKSRSKVARSNNDAFYPKLLIVIDNALFKKLDNDVEYATKYLSIFWSAVDLQYRNITQPQIEVRITGLIIAKNDKALHYVSANSPDGNSVNIDEVLYGSRNEKAFIDSTNITDYDAVVTMTGLSGYAEVGPNKVRVGSSGVSWNASICMDDYYFSVTTDDGSFSGIHSAIHELGHLLGLDHDAVPGNAFECFPTSRKQLTVMWPRYENREVEIWSECSVRALKIFSEDENLFSCCVTDPHQ
ncbi:venom metalloproteinase 2 [Nasonia vitripennis]|uniref:Peptidase M12B domain-containing protein n=1 Tax=Nasonia vitripennis TaxID=7425 RepID=A0A7M7G797_NASVI|nr:venom metalloproteinase 2 [Nasonia vitripennis]